MVKFGEQLASHRWAFGDVVPAHRYVDYDRLKQLIYDRDPAAFLQVFLGEVAKVFRVCMAVCLQVDNSQCQRCSGSRGATRVPLRKMQALDQYVRINREGCRKILKKFDKNNQTQVLTEYMTIVDALLQSAQQEVDDFLLRSMESGAQRPRSASCPPPPPRDDASTRRSPRHRPYAAGAAPSRAAQGPPDGESLSEAREQRGPAAVAYSPASSPEDRSIPILAAPAESAVPPAPDPPCACCEAAAAVPAPAGAEQPPWLLGTPLELDFDAQCTAAAAAAAAATPCPAAPAPQAQIPPPAPPGYPPHVAPPQGLPDWMLPALGAPAPDCGVPAPVSTQQANTSPRPAAAAADPPEESMIVWCRTERGRNQGTSVGVVARAAVTRRAGRGTCVTMGQQARAREGETVANATESLVYDPDNKARYLIPGKMMEDTAGWDDYPRKPKSFLCMLFQRGGCRAGRACNQLHVDREAIATLRSTASKGRVFSAAGGRHFVAELRGVLDPGTGDKIVVPYCKTEESAGRDAYGRCRGEGEWRLCTAHLDGSCRSGAGCRDIHVEPSHVVRVRHGDACCPEHAADRAERSPDMQLLVRVHGRGAEPVPVPVQAVCRTKGLLALSGGADGVRVFPIGKVCRLHQENRCDYGADCNNVHLCRKLYSTLRPDRAQRAEQGESSKPRGGAQGGDTGNAGSAGTTAPAPAAATAGEQSDEAARLMAAQAAALYQQAMLSRQYPFMPGMMPMWAPQPWAVPGTVVSAAESPGK